MSDTIQEEAEQSPPGLGPGDRLQAARISIGLTLEDVASKMHLSAGILGSLEENDFEEITAPIFVKGYLRSYARIVNLDEEDIIKQYSLYYTHNDPPILSTSNASPEINSDDARVKGTTWLIILILVGLLSFWWWSRYQQPTQTVSLDSSESTDRVASTSDAPSITSIPLSDSGSEISSSNEDDRSTGLLSGAEPIGAEVSVDQEARNELQNINDILPQADTVSQAEVQDEVSQQELEIEPVRPSSNNVAATTPSDLVITVNADTWADIKDANGNRLVYDLLRSGQNITLTGQAPFQAFLGNGYGVNIEYQGENIDLSKSIRADNTARIRIGQ